MAQAFWERLGGEGRSAGSAPAARITPAVLEAMRELGSDLSSRTPRPLDDADAAWAEVVVTMGCGDACPYLPGKRYVDWDIADPAGAPLETVREIRDDLRARVSRLAGEAASHDAAL